MPEKINPLTAGILLMLAVNIIYLDIAVFGKRGPVDSASVAFPAGTGEPSPAVTVNAETEHMPAPTITPSSVVSNTPVASKAHPREYYIPLGSGSTQSDTYSELPGVSAYIDTSLYPPIREVTFEAFVHIPAGIGWMHARLYNATDGHEVWGSEVTTESDTQQFRTSVVMLAPGRKLYTVQARSTIKAEARLTNARIKIITE